MADREPIRFYSRRLVRALLGYDPDAGIEGEDDSPVILGQTSEKPVRRGDARPPIRKLPGTKNLYLAEDVDVVLDQRRGKLSVDPAVELALDRGGEVTDGRAV